MRTIDLVRHAATTASDRLLGRSDAPLAPDAVTAALRQGAGRPWSRIVTSPLGRAQATASALGLARGVAPEVDADWTEYDFGLWDNRPLADLARDPGYQAFVAHPEAVRPPGGETWGDFQARLARALVRLEASADEVVVVTHGGAIRGALAVTTGLTFEQLWRLRISPATRVTLTYGRGPDGAFWGEICEIAQP